MKKKHLFSLMFVLFAALSITMFSSCGDDDDDDTTTDPNSLIGTWKMVSYESWSKEDGEEEHYVATAAELEEEYEIFTFNADGTYVNRYMDIDKGKEGSLTGTYTAKDGKIITNDGHDTIEATYSIKGNTLTVTEEYRDGDDWSKDVMVFKKQ